MELMKSMMYVSGFLFWLWVTLILLTVVVVTIGAMIVVLQTLEERRTIRTTKNYIHKRKDCKNNVEKKDDISTK